MKKAEERPGELIDASGGENRAAKDKALRKKRIKIAVKLSLAAAAVFYISSIFINFERLVGIGITNSVYYGDYSIDHYMSKTDDFTLHVTFSARHLSDSVVLLNIHTDMTRYDDVKYHYDIENLTATVRMVGDHEFHYLDGYYSMGGDKYAELFYSTYETLEVTGIYGWDIEYICKCPEDYCYIVMPISEIEGELEVHLLLDYDIVGKGLYSWNTFRGQHQELVYTIKPPETPDEEEQS